MLNPKKPRRKPALATFETGLAALMLVPTIWLIWNGFQLQLAIPDPTRSASFVDIRASHAQLGMWQIILGAFLPIMVGVFAFVAAARIGRTIWLFGAALSPLVFLTGMPQTLNLQMIAAFFEFADASGRLAIPSDGQIIATVALFYMLVGLSVLVGVYARRKTVWICILVLLVLSPLVAMIMVSDVRNISQAAIFAGTIILATYLITLFISVLDKGIRAAYFPLSLIMFVTIVIGTGVIFPWVSGLTAFYIQPETFALLQNPMQQEQVHLSDTIDRMLQSNMAQPVVMAATYQLNGLIATLGLCLVFMLAARQPVTVWLSWPLTIIAFAGVIAAILATTTRLDLLTLQSMLQDRGIILPDWLLYLNQGIGPTSGLYIISMVTSISTLLYLMPKKRMPDDIRK
ncbi:hypothetical protein [Parasulfitobacter algicola]|uniref:Uncharacterized protein n=1 Tax=Parasulfitobacter algicola TaxID=2614809 RepID=A0ABX2IQL1_9RHOB|nr:hypothetical protein [Sulfitobacter algicola]NSX55159.1 hypothetical protein [Sulfitobacter algicola]